MQNRTDTRNLTFPQRGCENALVPRPLCAAFAPSTAGTGDLRAMIISCVHCGKEFSITAEQLGGRGRCPHCHGDIQLPKADTAAPSEAAHHEPFNWLENSISGLGSMVFHIIVLLILALVPLGRRDGIGEGEEVFIGQLPGVKLSNAPEEELKADRENTPAESPPLDDVLENIPMPSDPSAVSANDNLAIPTPSPSGGGSASFDLGPVAIGGSVAGGNWEGMIQTLRRDGLDIVIAFDSTGSMSGEITQVKQQIKRIGSTLITLVPKARISICTYRDTSDEYVVKGTPLTGEIQKIDTYLSEISASGGGDTPEAVDEGLRWSVSNNQFRPRARKVILLFGDAPPHAERLKKCLQIASDFNSQEKGVVSTVTCRSQVRLDAFVEIAQAGGGEAFLTTDERQIMTQLLVLVFGSQYRGKVIEAFKLLDE